MEGEIFTIFLSNKKEYLVDLKDFFLFMRRLYKLIKPKVNFKSYRNSPEFKPVAKDIEASVRGMLKHCRRTECVFSKCDIDRVISKFGEGNSDFNDQLMLELCKYKGFALITHDRDFSDCGLTILTANKQLLA
ncbi:MAG: hypothetical protein HZA01_04735 [Nitrospinae bacterium]|nr:hypothetical protein [Nitrospinota bacterium]